MNINVSVIVQVLSSQMTEKSTKLSKKMEGKVAKIDKNGKKNEVKSTKNLQYRQ